MAKTKIIKFVPLVVLLVITMTDGLPASLPQPETTDGWKRTAEMFLTSINKSVDPCQNFYEYSCGNYIAKHPIGDAPSQSTFNELQKTVWTNLTQAIENGNIAEKSEAVKVARDVYAACKAVKNDSYPDPTLVLAIANEYGGWPLLNPSWTPSKIKKDIFWTMGDMFTRYGVATLFVPTIDTDWGKPEGNHLLFLDQASLQIPAEYYRSPKLTQRYQNVLRQSIFAAAKQLSGGKINNETLLPQIDRIVQIEYDLAQIMVNASEQRNASMGYNKYNAQKARDEFPNYNWASYFEGLLDSVVPKIDPAFLDPFIIAEPRRYGRHLNEKLAQWTQNQAQLTDFVNYLIYRLVSPYMEFAGPESAQIFELLKKETRIILDEPHISDRQQKCVSFIIDNLNFAAGRLYVDQSFPEQNRDDVMVMINNVLSAFSSSLSGLRWMDNPSALKAFNKVAGLVRTVAYPDFQQHDNLLDDYYRSLIDSVKSIDSKDKQAYYKYNRAVIAFTKQLAFGLLKIKGDRAEFGMSPAVVNAWYQPERNSITFPAAILNEPFYRYDFPQAVNYGALGVVMGHELSHGFDDQGVQFDFDGTLRTWMTPKAESGFNKMAQCVVDEYSRFCYPGIACINGITTQGENIGDNGGLKAAYHAYKAYAEAHGEEQPLPGMETFTMDQIFFLAYGQVWCGSYSQDALTRQLLTNPHSPGKDRVIGAVQNFPKFAEAFKCKKGDPMYPQSSCDVW